MSCVLVSSLAQDADMVDHWMDKNILLDISGVAEVLLPAMQCMGRNSTETSFERRWDNKGSVGLRVWRAVHAASPLWTPRSLHI